LLSFFKVISLHLNTANKYQ